MANFNDTLVKDNLYVYKSVYLTNKKIPLAQYYAGGNETASKTHTAGSVSHTYTWTTRNSGIMYGDLGSPTNIAGSNIYLKGSEINLSAVNGSIKKIALVSDNLDVVANTLTEYLSSKTSDIYGNKSETVRGSVTETYTGNLTSTISGKHSETVTGEYALSSSNKINISNTSYTPASSSVIALSISSYGNARLESTNGVASLIGASTSINSSGAAYWYSNGFAHISNTGSRLRIAQSSNDTAPGTSSDDGDLVIISTDGINQWSVDSVISIRTTDSTATGANAIKLSSDKDSNDVSLFIGSNYGDIDIKTKNSKSIYINSSNNLSLTAASLFSLTGTDLSLLGTNSAKFGVEITDVSGTRGATVKAQKSGSTYTLALNGYDGINNLSDNGDIDFRSVLHDITFRAPYGDIYSAGNTITAESSGNLSIESTNGNVELTASDELNADAYQMSLSADNYASITAGSNVYNKLMVSQTVASITAYNAGDAAKAVFNIGGNISFTSRYSNSGSYLYTALKLENNYLLVDAEYPDSLSRNTRFGINYTVNANNKYALYLVSDNNGIYTKTTDLTLNTTTGSMSAYSKENVLIQAVRGTNHIAGRSVTIGATGTSAGSNGILIKNVKSAVSGSVNDAGIYIHNQGGDIINIHSKNKGIAIGTGQTQATGTDVGNDIVISNSTSDGQTIVKATAGVRIENTDSEQNHGILLKNQGTGNININSLNSPIGLKATKLILTNADTTNNTLYGSTIPSTGDAGQIFFKVV